MDRQLSNLNWLKKKNKQIFVFHLHINAAPQFLNLFFTWNNHNRSILCWNCIWTQNCSSITRELIFFVCKLTVWIKILCRVTLMASPRERMLVKQTFFFKSKHSSILFFSTHRIWLVKVQKEKNGSQLP